MKLCLLKNTRIRTKVKLKKKTWLTSPVVIYICVAIMEEA